MPAKSHRRIRAVLTGSVYAVKPTKVVILWMWLNTN